MARVGLRGWLCSNHAAAMVFGWFGLLAAAARGAPVLQYGPTPAGPWTEDTHAVIVDDAGGRFRACTLTPAASRFFRLVDHGGATVLPALSIQPSVTMEFLGTERTVTLPGSVPLVLVRIPAGTSDMGSPDDERSRWSDEEPVHQVTIGYDVHLGKHEVTQAQWLALMGSWPGPAPSPVSGAGDTHPAYYVNWSDAAGFMAALNAHIVATGQGPLTVRLPSEAEWEYACRAGTRTRFSFGDSLVVGDDCEDDAVRGQSMWYCGNNNPYGTKPAGSKSANTFGLHDMHGSVYEWCADGWHDSYAGAPADGSAWAAPAGSNKVIRGGYWASGARTCRSAYRESAPPSYRDYHLGFRVAAVE